MGNYVTIHEEYKHKFFQLPKVFFTNDKYINLSNNSKIAWALLRDRSSISRKNKWFDKDTGRIYFIYRNIDLMEILNIKSPTTITGIRKELREANLIEEKDLGFNQPKKVYLIYPEITNSDIYAIDNIENYNYEETTTKEPSSQAGQGLSNIGSPNIDSPVSQNMTPSNTKSSNTSSKELDTEDTKDTNLDSSKNKHSLSIEAIKKEKRQKQKEYMDKAFYQNTDFIPQKIADMLDVFSNSTEEAKEYYDVILIAKNNVEKETGQIIWLENEDELTQEIINSFSRARRKIEKDKNIKNPKGYIYRSIYDVLNTEIRARLAYQKMNNGGIYDLSNDN